MANIICIDCQEQEIEMEKMRCGQDLIVDKCPRCGGIWFDKEELIDLIKLGQFYIQSLDSASESTIKPNPERLCPHCKVELNPAKNQKIPDLRLDKCPRCQGLWLEKGELLRISKLYGK